MTSQLKNKPRGFQFQPMSQAKRNQNEKNGMLSHVALSMASDARVQANTPSLKSLYEFLGTKPGERPRL